MKVLVTGGAGFIGSHLCAKLVELGHQVLAVDNLDPFYPAEIKLANIRPLERFPDRFRFVRLDILDATALGILFREFRPDAVVHLAARAGVRPSLEAPALYQRVNVEGTANVLEAARLTQTKKIVLASSSSVYGIRSKVPFSETDPLTAPISPYAASKIACEALAHVYHHLYGFDVAVLRYFTVYGPGQRPDLAIHKFTRLIWEGKPVPVFGDPDKSARDYTYIEDIVRGTVACLERELGFQIINLGRSDVVSLSRLLSLLEEACGRKAIIDWQPAQPGDVPITYADISRARALLGYEPKTPIEDGIPRFVEWFKAVVLRR